MESSFASINNDIDIYEKYSQIQPIIENLYDPDQEKSDPSMISITSIKNPNMTSNTGVENNLESTTIDTQENEEVNVTQENEEVSVTQENDMEENNEVVQENVTVEEESKGSGISIKNIVILLLLLLILTKIVN